MSVHLPPRQWRVNAGTTPRIWSSPGHGAVELSSAQASSQLQIADGAGVGGLEMASQVACTAVAFLIGLYRGHPVNIGANAATCFH